MEAFARDRAAWRCTPPAFRPYCIALHRLADISGGGSDIW